MRGYATDFEYGSMPGATITVTNLETNEDSTATVDEDGAYSVDLGDTSAGAFPSGYSIGDEIQISCTHRDATRSWKRRVAGSELVQDIHFTHGTWKGAMRKAKLIQTELFTSPSGLTLTLRDSHARDVLSVTKNGALMAEADWSFTRPSTITLTTASSSSDVYEVEELLYRTETDAKTIVVNDGDAPVRNAIARYYATPLPTRVPELQDLSESLAAAALRDRIFTSGGRADEDAKSLRARAEKALEDIRNGTRGLTDQDDAFLTPNAQTTTTPQSSVTPTRRATRWTTDNAKLEL